MTIFGKFNFLGSQKQLFKSTLILKKIINACLFVTMATFNLIFLKNLVEKGLNTCSMDKIGKSTLCTLNLTGTLQLSHQSISRAIWKRLNYNSPKYISRSLNKTCHTKNGNQSSTQNPKKIAYLKLSWLIVCFKLTCYILHNFNRRTLLDLFAITFRSTS